jgi:hypothetical protein
MIVNTVAAKLKTIAVVMTGFFFIILMLATWGYAMRGTAYAAFAILQGQALVSPSWSYVVILRSGEKDVLVETPVRNISNETLKIIGAETSCACANAVDLPVELGVGQQQVIKWRIKSQDNNLRAVEASLIFGTPLTAARIHFDLRPESAAGAD